MKSANEATQGRAETTTWYHLATGNRLVAVTVSTIDEASAHAAKWNADEDRADSIVCLVSNTRNPREATRLRALYEAPDAQGVFTWANDDKVTR